MGRLLTLHVSMPRWSDCSGRVDYSRKDLLTPVLPLYTKFFSENNLRILVYSGDTDGVVPHTGQLPGSNAL